MGEYDEQIIFEMGYNSGFKDGIKGSIPKDQYEARLKADMVAMLTEIQLEIEEMKMQSLTVKEIWNNAIDVCSDRIQQKINALRGE